MAFSFPVPVADFAAELQVRRVAWDLREFYVESGTRSGRLLRKVVAEPLWTAELQLVPMEFADARRARAMIRRIGMTNAFNLYNPAVPYPRFDPDGTTLGSASVTVNAVGGHGLRLAGLPAGYRLAWGDFLSIGHAGGGRSLHEVSEFCEANGSGVTPWFDVSPAARQSAAVGDGVDLKRPAARMMFAGIDPGISEGVIADGIVLQAIEVR